MRNFWVLSNFFEKAVLRTIGKTQLTEINKICMEIVENLIGFLTNSHTFCSTSNKFVLWFFRNVKLYPSLSGKKIEKNRVKDAFNQTHP